MRPSTTVRSPSPSAVNVTGHKACSQLIVDSTKVASAKMKALEDVLYGTDGTVTWTKFTGSAFVEGTDYYERSGTSPNYTYTKTADSEPQSGKDYYTKSATGGTEARLPLPDEVLSILQRAS